MALIGGGHDSIVIIRKDKLVGVTVKDYVEKV